MSLSPATSARSPQRRSWLDAAADLLDPPASTLGAEFAATWRCDRPDCDGQPHRGRSFRHARSAQVVPSDAKTAYISGGRGSGKTKTGSWNLAQMALDTVPAPGDDHTEWAVIAPTYGDARDVCVEGPSGLLRALGPQRVAKWDRTMGKLQLVGGAVVWVDSGSEGALRIQGKNLNGAWLSEIGLWRLWERAWKESIAYAVRKAPSRLICDGTPKRGSLAAYLLSQPDDKVYKARLRMRDNIANLDPDRVAELEAEYAGTRLGRQELEGELLDDVDGALWSLANLEQHRLHPDDELPDMDRVVVGIDPAASASEDSDETGIVAVGRAGAHLYVLDDCSGHYTPTGWAHAALSCLGSLAGDRIVAEVNNGGDMVEATLRNVDPDTPVRKVHASRGKAIRAEPVAALYDQGRVHHVGAFPRLEDQMTTWVPGDSHSPDRMDALVWAITDLVEGAAVRRGRITYVSRRRGYAA